jgi:hypothetical protein
MIFRIAPKLHRQSSFWGLPPIFGMLNCVFARVARLCFAQHVGHRHSDFPSASFDSRQPDMFKVSE